MYTCEKCGCNYDAGEIKGGICVDCLERQQQRAKREKDIRQLMQKPSYQLTFDLNGCGTVTGPMR